MYIENSTRLASLKNLKASNKVAEILYKQGQAGSTSETKKEDEPIDTEVSDK